uniref:G-protein coupled receptors family 1 profile domain-containing protein n=1 Tax=Acrobeloides nanus TaxID=290746 RepID=A0A914E1D1_9BILA
MVHSPIMPQASDTSITNHIRQVSIQTHKRHASISLHRCSGPPINQKAQKMVIKMLVTVSAVFFACYLPYHIQRLIVQYIPEQCDKSQICLILYPITGLLQYVSATLNPIIYNLMSVRFRKASRAFMKKLINLCSYPAYTYEMTSKPLKNSKNRQTCF